MPRSISAQARRGKPSWPIRAAQPGRGGATRRRDKVDAMPIEMLSFFMIAASLVLLGFATGPVVARKVHIAPRRRLH
jgi:hypothetical protein